MLDLIRDQDTGSDYTRFDLVLGTSFEIILLNYGFLPHFTIIKLSK